MTGLGGDSGARKHELHILKFHETSSVSSCRLHLLCKMKQISVDASGCGFQQVILLCLLIQYNFFVYFTSDQTPLDLTL
ncbi:hypothetical protein FKM82_016910 [Ascaphus truei]